MSISNLSQNRWLIRVRTRINGRTIGRKKVVTGSRKDAKVGEVELQRELTEEAADKKRSLKICTFSEALTFYKENTTAKLDTIETLLRRLDRDLGNVLLRDLSEKFGEYLLMLKTERTKRTGKLLSPATRNRLLVYAKTSLSFCMKRGHIDRNPLAGFSKLPEEPRDRILTTDEETRLLNTLRKNDSYLYRPVKFSLRNPIRKGDLVSLTRENLDRFRPWIHFHASKTRNRKNRETVLPFLEKDMLEYFDSLPADCPYLFPRIDVSGNWHCMGDFKKHWHTMLREAGIQDFHWHDLKHCAITWMLDNGYSERDLRNLGIQYSPAMINRYYHTDAQKVLLKWQGATTGATLQQQKMQHIS